MSDGSGSGGPAEMTQIYNSHRSRGLQVHTVAFGTRANTGTLRELATLGGGEFHESITGDDLIKTFVEITTGLTTVDGLIEEFAKRISDAATNKLMLEFL